MDKKAKDLIELHSYIEGVDKEVTMLLQSLQWDRKHLLEGSTLVPCRYDATHKVPPDKKELHEKECFLRCEGYTKEDVLLPDPLDPKAPTVVQLNKEDIQTIINNAAQADPSFQRGAGGAAGCEPLTAGRLQVSYSADERRAIYDVVVSSAPDFEHVEDIGLASAEVKQERRRKSKLEVLAELRDMRRRRVKYRGAGGAANNYSNVLRDLIKTQMELYTGASVDSAPQHPNTSRQTSKSHDNTIHIKQESITDEESGHNQHSKRDRHSQRNDDSNRRSHREQDNYRRDRYNTDRNHRDTERNEYRQDRDRHRHGRTYASSWEDVRIKKEPNDDRKERGKEREGNRQENKERRRSDNRHYETHSKTNDRYVHDRDGRREEPTDKRLSREYDKGHSKSKARKEYSEDSSSSYTQTSRKRKHSDDNESREPRHNRTKFRETSRSKTRERETKADSHKESEDMYKRYYAMRRALAHGDAKR